LSVVDAGHFSYHTFPVILKKKDVETETKFISFCFSKRDKSAKGDGDLLASRGWTTQSSEPDNAQEEYDHYPRAISLLQDQQRQYHEGYDDKKEC
jgi:hypothetical protein